MDNPTFGTLFRLYQKWQVSIIPLQYKSKLPAIASWKPYQEHRPDLAELGSWFADIEQQPKNIGLVCGAVSGGFTVLDFDNEVSFFDFVDKWNALRHRDIHEETPIVATARGYHVYLRLKDIPKTVKLPSGIDIKAEGGYVLAPPSVHPSGHIYQFVNPQVIKPLAINTLADIGIEAPKQEGISSNEPGWVRKALQGAPEGERDITCTKLAGYFRNKVPQAVCVEILVPWGDRCTPPFPPEDVQKVVVSVYRYGEPIEEVAEPEEPLLAIPKLPEGVWQGLFADYRDLVAETTEAPNTYHYACFAQVLGATLARRLYVYHARRLFPNFYICLVGKTAVSRKDTAWYRARRFLDDLHTEENPENPQFQIIPGIGSAEGLLDALGGERKVVVVTESELLSLLAKARQEGLSNLIPKLTSLYDCPDRETLKTRQRAVECHEPFLSISSSTTSAWLQKALTEKDIYGGFANRFIFVSGDPKAPLPFPPKMDPAKYNALLSRINNVRLWATNLAQQAQGGELDVLEETKAQFADYYSAYHKRCAVESLPATLIPRVQTFIWKLALLYAAMDNSQVLLPKHLEPAILAGDYFEQSVLQVFHTFATGQGRETENQILCYLRQKKEPVTERNLYRGLGLSAKDLLNAVNPLVQVGLIRQDGHRSPSGKYKVRTYEAI